MAGIPSQRRRCATYDWCTAATRGHRVHTSESQTLTAATGVRLRVSLCAEDDREPFVHIEASFGPDEPLLEIAELDPAEALELAGMFLRQARQGHASHQHHRQH